MTATVAQTPGISELLCNWLEFWGSAEPKVLQVEPNQKNATLWCYCDLHPRAISTPGGCEPEMGSHKRTERHWSQRRSAPHDSLAETGSGHTGAAPSQPERAQTRRSPRESGGSAVRGGHASWPCALPYISRSAGRAMPANTGRQWPWEAGMWGVQNPIQRSLGQDPRDTLSATPTLGWSPPSSSARSLISPRSAPSPSESGPWASGTFLGPGGTVVPGRCLEGRDSSVPSAPPTCHHFHLCQEPQTRLQTRTRRARCGRGCRRPGPCPRKQGSQRGSGLEVSCVSRTPGRGSGTGSGEAAEARSDPRGASGDHRRGGAHGQASFSRATVGPAGHFSGRPLPARSAGRFTLPPSAPGHPASPCGAPKRVSRAAAPTRKAQFPLLSFGFLWLLSATVAGTRTWPWSGRAGPRVLASCVRGSGWEAGSWRLDHRPRWACGLGAWIHTHRALLQRCTPRARSLSWFLVDTACPRPTSLNEFKSPRSRL